MDPEYFPPDKRIVEESCKSFDFGLCMNPFISHDRNNLKKCHDVKKHNYPSYLKYFTKYPLIDKIERIDTKIRDTDNVESIVTITHYPVPDQELDETEWVRQATGFFTDIGYHLQLRNEPQYNYQGYWCAGRIEFLSESSS
jgi:hypothetical protein